MTTAHCGCAAADLEIHAKALTGTERPETGWLAAAVALMAALVAGLSALSPLTGPACAPKADAAYADVLTTRDWKAAIASESRLGLAPGRVRAAC